MHETVETLETLSAILSEKSDPNCLNCLKNLMQIFALQGDFLHDQLDKVGKVPLQLVKLVNFAMRFFIRVPANFNLWGERKHKLPVNLAKRY